MKNIIFNNDYIEIYVNTEEAGKVENVLHLIKYLNGDNIKNEADFLEALDSIIWEDAEDFGGITYYSIENAYYDIIRENNEDEILEYANYWVCLEEDDSISYKKQICFYYRLKVLLDELDVLEKIIKTEFIMYYKNVITGNFITEDDYIDIIRCECNDSWYLMDEDEKEYYKNDIKYYMERCMEDDQDFIYVNYEGTVWSEL